MNVRELREILDKYPDEMEVLNERCSDYDIISPDEWKIVKAVPKGGYVMRPHKTMSEENKAKEKEYLLLVGN